MRARLDIHAIKTPQEIQQGFVARKLSLRPHILRYSNDNFEKPAEDIFFVDNLPNECSSDDSKAQFKSRMTHSLVPLFSFTEQAFKNNHFGECLSLQFTLTPHSFSASDYRAYLNEKKQRNNKR